MGFSSKSSSPGDRLLFQILGIMEPPWRGILGKWNKRLIQDVGGESFRQFQSPESIFVLIEKDNISNKICPISI